MSKTDDAWEEVGSHFSTLGRRFKEHYGAKEDEEAGSDLREAFRGLIDAADRVASTIGQTVRDEQVRSEAKAAAGSFVNALGATFGELGEELKKVFPTRSQPPEEAEREVQEAAGEAMPPAESEIPTTEEAGAAHTHEPEGEEPSAP